MSIWLGCAPVSRGREDAPGGGLSRGGWNRAGRDDEDDDADDDEEEEEGDDVADDGASTQNDEYSRERRLFEGRISVIPRVNAQGVFLH